MSKRAKIISAVVVLVIVAGVVGYFALAGQGAGPEVETAMASKQELAVTVTASGRVDSGVSADVFPPAQGTLDTIDVTDGEQVTAGQRLAKMDTEALELQVSQARAGLAQAQAQLATVDATAGSSKDVTAAKKGVTAAEKGVTAAKAGVTAARTAWRDAEKAHEQASKVLPSNSTTLTALAQAEKQAFAGYKQAQAAQAQAEAGLSQAKAGLGKAQAGNSSSPKSAAQAAVDSARDALTLAEKALEDATLEAPIDGVVIFNGTPTATGAMIKPTEGAAVSPAAAPFTVVDMSGLKFTAEVDEADVDRIDPEMPATITLDAFPGEEFASKVTRLNPAAQTTATGGTVFAVELELAGIDKEILIGMKGDATIEVSARPAAITIPVEALFSEGGTDFVYVVENGRLVKTEITVGATTDTEVEVLEGLVEGATVALSGATPYVDGMAVRIKQ